MSILPVKKIKRDFRRIIKSFDNLSRSPKFRRDLRMLRGGYGHNVIEAAATKALHESQPPPKSEYIKYKEAGWVVGPLANQLEKDLNTYHQIRLQPNPKESDRNRYVLKLLGRQKVSGTKCIVPRMPPLSEKEKHYLMGRVIADSSRIPDAEIRRFAYRWNIRHEDASNILLFDLYPSTIPIKGRDSKSHAKKRRKPTPKRFWWEQRILQKPDKKQRKEFVLRKHKQGLSAPKICGEWSMINADGLSEDAVKKIILRDKKRKGH